MPTIPRIAFAIALALAIVQDARTPDIVVNELLDADRGFAKAAAKRTVVPALSAMFADDVVMPTPAAASGFARGKAQAIEALNRTADNATGRVEWAPIRGGVSADGQHGFTFGYMTLTRSDRTTMPLKYVAYWVRTPEGWRVAVYKRVRAEQPPDSRELMPPALPARLVPPVTDAATVARSRASLEAAERAFSDEAQKIGLGPAFAKHGSADAVNVGPPTSRTFVVSVEAIGRSVGAGSEGKPSPMSWAPDVGAIVASSGDLGVTFGYIRPNAPPPAGQPSAIPFITIWRRANPDSPWRYIAE
jgi:ketosteroid isomerase-like protein